MLNDIYKDCINIKQICEAKFNKIPDGFWKTLFNLFVLKYSAGVNYLSNEINIYVWMQYNEYT